MPAPGLPVGLLLRRFDGPRLRRSARPGLRPACPAPSPACVPLLPGASSVCAPFLLGASPACVPFLPGDRVRPFGSRSGQAGRAASPGARAFRTALTPARQPDVPLVARTDGVTTARQRP